MLSNMSYFQYSCTHVQNRLAILTRPFMSEVSNWLTLFQRSSWPHTLHFKNGSVQLQHFTQKGCFQNVVKFGFVLVCSAKVMLAIMLVISCFFSNASVHSNSIPLCQLREPKGLLPKICAKGCADRKACFCFAVSCFHASQKVGSYGRPSQGTSGKSKNPIKSIEAHIGLDNLGSGIQNGSNRIGSACCQFHILYAT